MVANYQYLITCMAFSTAKPFRKAIWTNWPFFFCVVFLFVFNGLCIFLPSTTRVSSRFDLQPFETFDPDVSYYDAEVGDVEGPAFLQRQGTGDANTLPLSAR